MKNEFITIGHTNENWRLISLNMIWNFVVWTIWEQTNRERKNNNLWMEITMWDVMMTRAQKIHSAREDKILFCVYDLNERCGTTELL